MNSSIPREGWALSFVGQLILPCKPLLLLAIIASLGGRSNEEEIPSHNICNLLQRQGRERFKRKGKVAPCKICIPSRNTTGNKIILSNFASALAFFRPKPMSCYNDNSSTDELKEMAAYK